MTQKDKPTLEDALDGLQLAERYAASIGEEELAREIAHQYQLIGEKAPDDHWDEPPKLDHVDSE